MLLREKLRQGSLKIYDNDSNDQSTSRYLLTDSTSPLRVLFLSPIMFLISLYEQHYC